MFGGEIHHALAIMQEYPVGEDEKAIRLLLDDRVKRGVEVFRFAYLARLQLDIQSLCRGERLAQRHRMKFIRRIEEESDVGEVGHDLPQQLQPFAFKVRRDRAESGDV